MLEVRLLGQFILKQGEEVLELPSRPAQSLLAYLILHAGKPQRREKLAGMLWPEAEESNARSYLRHALWRVRKIVEEGFFEADKISITFVEEQPYWLDVKILETVDPGETSLEESIQGLSVYGGELLPGFYEDWVTLERERLKALFERKVQSLLERLLTEAEWGLAMEWAERWIALGNSPEPAFRALMLAQAGKGDMAGIGTAYQRCKEILNRELNVLPSEETQMFYEELSQGAPPEALLSSPNIGHASVGMEDSAANLLELWKNQGVEILDVASLAMVHASPEEQIFRAEDIRLLIKSAIHHGVDLEPWIERADSAVEVIETLQECYEDYPKPGIRKRIVESLNPIDHPKAGDLLLRISTGDDSLQVRSLAALGRDNPSFQQAVAARTLKRYREEKDPLAWQMLVEMADHLPLSTADVSGLGLGFRLAVAHRRWREQRSRVGGLILRSLLGSSLTMGAYGAAIPLFTYLARKDFFQEALELFTLPAWILSGAVAMLIVGIVFGTTLGLSVGVVELLSLHHRSSSARLMAGGLGGLAYSAYLIGFSLLGLLSPEVDPGLYIPVYLLYGFALGTACSTVVPSLGKRLGKARFIRNALVASLILAAITVPYTFLIYQGEASATLFSRMVLVLVLPWGVGLAFRVLPRTEEAI